MFKGWPLVPLNVTLFGNRVIANVMKLRAGHMGLGQALNRGQCHVKTHWSMSDVSTSQEMPSTAGSTRSWERGSGFSLSTPTRNQHCWHLIFRFLASRTVKGNTQIMVFCSKSPRKLLQAASARGLPSDVEGGDQVSQASMQSGCCHQPRQIRLSDTSPVMSTLATYN